MFPFWEMVVAPLVKAAGAQRVLEIGALRGETTAKMFDQLGPTSELHVIDPLPQFDPDEHAREFPGRYVFHRALSLDVLADLPSFDVALIDGDHNWYTVYHELKALDVTSRKAKRPLPLPTALHDVAWPYGHRDLYYEPSQIPEGFRQPHMKAGMAPGHHRLLPEGGFNVDLDNAIDGGGPRNGVMRALEDFLEEHDRPYRMVLLPFYYGLAIVVEEDRLAETPEVGRLLDHLESSAGRLRLLKLSERIRIDEQVHVHNWNRVLERRTDVQRRRYLDLLKSSLLDLPYLENEVRLDYLTRLPAGAEPEVDKLRDPFRTLWVRYKRVLQDREAGRANDDAPNVISFPYTDMGRAALDHLESVVAGLTSGTVPGDVVECGAGRGGGGVFMKAVLQAHSLHDPRVVVVDPFVVSEAAPAGSGPLDLASQLATHRADLSQVRDAYDRFDLLDDRVRFVQGEYADALADADIEHIAVLRVGRSAGTDLEPILSALLPKVSAGGTVVIEGVGRPPVQTALDGVRTRLGITDHLERVSWDTVSWTVGTPPPAVAVDEARPKRLGRRPAPRRIAPVPAAPPDPVDLSVVVVFYNMRREAVRTLQSLTRSYQRDIEGLTYEVIAVENGSDPTERLTAAEVAAYGPEFRLLDLAEQATSSPTTALNRGIAEARGENLALMIDGAHVLTPGVLHHAMTALAAYAPAVVATQQWYVGPGQQPDAQQTGYDQAVEDRLFRQVRWPTDGYRLFEIGHFIGDRDWFDGIIESNCLVVPRKILEQVGAFDDGFDMPGGGYTNLELFERLHTHPGVTPVSILGEGSFHQFHGGTTTNVADEGDRRNRIVSYREHFADLRGRGLQGLNKPVHYVGAMDTKAARRTRSRRELLLAFNADRDPVTTTDTTPMPVPEEVKLAAIEAIWENQSWRQATWLGHPVNRFPTDLQTVQELLAELRPATLVLIGDDDGLGGRALHAASVFDQLGAGRVVALGASPVGDRPSHPRITHLEGLAEDPTLVGEVTRVVGGDAAMVVIALGAVGRVSAAFEAYHPLVPADGYIVVENTVVNGRPSESGFGPGPHEAVNELLQRHRDFVPDVTRERYTVTFNKNGYLRRIASS